MDRKTDHETVKSTVAYKKLTKHIRHSRSVLIHKNTSKVYEMYSNNDPVIDRYILFLESLVREEDEVYYDTIVKLTDELIGLQTRLENVIRSLEDDLGENLFEDLV